MDNNNVSLIISKEIVTPIVEAKVKEAVLCALGGKDELTAKIVDDIITRKVDAKGKVSNYSSDNKFTWLDIVLTNQIKSMIEEELKTIISASSSTIKDALVNQIRTKSGSNKVAKALLDGLNNSFDNSWRSTINIAISPITGG